MVDKARLGFGLLNYPFEDGGTKGRKCWRLVEWTLYGNPID